MIEITRWSLMPLDVGFDVHVLGMEVVVPHDLRQEVTTPYGVARGDRYQVAQQLHDWGYRVAGVSRCETCGRFAPTWGREPGPWECMTCDPPQVYNIPEPEP